MRRAFAIVVLILLVWPAAASAPSGDAIIAAMKRQFSAVNDYKVDVSLTVKGPQVSINNMGMSVYFKKPNKVHVDATQGFAMVPSGNFFGDPMSELASGAHATCLRTEKKQGRECYVLDLGAARPGTLLWVDRERSVMVATEGPGAFKTSWRYGKIDSKYYLPIEICAEMPNPRGGSQDRPIKATIKLANYRVNKGISDKIFQEKTPKPTKMRRYRH